MDPSNKTTEIDQNCEDDIPLLEVRRSPDDQIKLNKQTETGEDCAAGNADPKVTQEDNLQSQNTQEVSAVSVPTADPATDTDPPAAPSPMESLQVSENLPNPKHQEPSPMVASSSGQAQDIVDGGPKIQVDQSHLTQMPNSDQICPVRKLELSDTPVSRVKQETFNNEDTEAMALQCDEKIGDSPELEKKSESKVDSQETSEIKTELVEDLLKPLQMDESVGKVDMKANLSLSLNEFGLVEVPKLLKEDVKRDVTASPRKDAVGRRIQDDNILCCEGCGCYGMAGEFVAQNSCSAACNRIILEKVREKQRKEREALKQKQKREAKNKARELGQPRSGHYNEDYCWQTSDGFDWLKYLEWTSSKAAPVTLFKPDPFPSSHRFTKLMKLEAVDPLNQSCICVVTVAEVVGPRLRLHFDGYSDSYDFWENCNSENLFPVGWCSKNNQRLVPPKGFTPTNFDWDSYLSITKSVGASEELFKNKLSHNVSTDGWKVGAKLESADPDKPDLVHVATVTNIVEGRVLIHFDGWSHNYDFWTLPSSPHLHPAGWCEARGKSVAPPLDSGHTPATFSWPAHLAATAASPVPSWAFEAVAGRERSEFVPGMRLEAVDVRNPALVRVASVAAVAGRRVKVHYDGWPPEFDVWQEDSSGDLHPCGWAARTGHGLLSPLTPEEIKHWAERAACATPGCRGLGHVRGARYSSHHLAAACPYSKQNLDHEDSLPDRLGDSEGHRMKSEDGDDKDSSVVPVVVGKTGRRRRKRKFYDDDNGKNENGFRVKMERRDSQDSKTSVSSRSDSRASGSTDSSKLTERVDQETQTGGGADTFAAEWEESVRCSVFRPGYLPQPFPVGALPFNWREHSRLLLGRRGRASCGREKVRCWNIGQVCDFISEIPNIDHSAISSRLSQEEIDGESLLSLTQADLTSILEIKLGPAIKIFNAITALKIKS